MRLFVINLSQTLDLLLVVSTVETKCKEVNGEELHLNMDKEEDHFKTSVLVLQIMAQGHQRHNKAITKVRIRPNLTTKCKEIEAAGMETAKEIGILEIKETIGIKANLEVFQAIKEVIGIKANLEVSQMIKEETNIKDKQVHEVG